MATTSTYEAALEKLRKAPAGKRDGEEKAYGLAYQKMVSEGTAPQLRKRYRP